MLKRRGGRGRRSQECQYGLGEGGGIKPVAQLPAVVPSVVPHPAQPAALGAVRGGGGEGGDKTGSSTVGGGPVCGTSPSPASSVRSSTGGGGG